MLGEDPGRLQEDSGSGRFLDQTRNIAFKKYGTLNSQL